MVPLMSITRNFFMGRAPTKWRGPFRRIDGAFADRVASDEMHKIGSDVPDPPQPVGPLSSSQRQCAPFLRVSNLVSTILIPDAPNSAPGLTKTSMVLDQL